MATNTHSQSLRPPTAALVLPLSHLIPIGSQDFAFAEQQWLFDKQLPEFLEIDHDSENAVWAFQMKMFAAFLDEFPWRSYWFRNIKIGPEVLCRETGWDLENHGTAPSRMYNWLASNAPKGKRVNRISEFYRPAAPPEGVLYPSDHYRPSERDLVEEQRSIRHLLNHSHKVWSSMDGALFDVQRHGLISHIDNIVRAIARCFAVELVGIGLYEQHQKIVCFDVSTPRTKPFVESQAFLDAQDAYIGWATRTIGPHLVTSIGEVASSVYGDPNRDYRPVFPKRQMPEPQLRRQLDIWMNAYWRYSGGQGDVPYDLLEQDSRTGQFALTDSRRYPVGVGYIQSPFKMPDDHLTSWATHIKRAEWGELSENEEFAFKQPRPGLHILCSPQHIHPQAGSIAYPPESLLYARRRENVRAERRDVFESTTGLPYRSLSPQQQKHILDILPTDSRYIAHRLLTALQDYDDQGPVQMPIQRWENLVTKASPLPFVPTSTPDPYVGMQFLRVDNEMFLSKDFVAPPAGQEHSWSIWALICFAQHPLWQDKVTPVIYGGPCGFKWAVLATLAAKSTFSRLRSRGKKPKWFTAKLNPGPRAEKEIDLLTERITTRLEHSTALIKQMTPIESLPYELSGPNWMIGIGPNNWERVEIRGPAEWQNEWEASTNFAVDSGINETP
ncbi:ubiquitin specific protease 25 [Ceratobasidium sp. AG-Ba]|nr:ubiquitin specific protease 25 [Ceratobasidium sp. AG-Ba]